jgi:O-antigen/teichoic acid export membrane protein
VKINRSRRRTTQWNLFFHYGAIFFAIVSGIVLVPLYLRFIPLDLYGAWLATGNIIAWFTVIDPGLSSVLQQRTGVAYGKGDIEEVSALLSSGVLLSLVVSVFILVTGLVSSRFLIGWLNLATNLDHNLLEQAFILAVVGSTFLIFSYSLSAFNQGLQSSLGIGLVYISTILISLVLTVLFLKQGMGLLALPMGLVVRGVGFTIGNLGYLIWRTVSEKLRFRFTVSGLKSLVKLSSYMFLGRGAGVLANNLDAFMLTRYLGPDLAPVFVLTRKAPDLSLMVLDRPTTAFMPAVSSLVGEGEIERAKIILLRLLRIILWLLGMVAGGFLIFNGVFVSMWVGSDLYAGGLVNSIIVLVLIISVLTNALSNLCFSLGNIKGNSIAALAQGLLAIPFIIFGVQWFGIVGVAVAPLLAMLAVSVWYYPKTFIRLLKLDRGDIKIIAREAAAIAIAIIAAVGGFFWIPVKGWTDFALLMPSFCLVYIVVLVVFSPLFKTEVRGIISSNRFSMVLNIVKIITSKSSRKL